MPAPRCAVAAARFAQVALLAAMAFVFGCRAGELTSDASGCRFGADHDVAHAEAHGFDDVALVPVPDAHVALWSTPDGLFGRRLSGDGRPLEETVALGGRCRGGLSAAAVGHRVHVACLEVPHRLQRAPDTLPSVLRWLVIDGGRGLAAVGEPEIVGDVGVASDAVSLVAGPSERVWVAWRDVHGLDETVRLMRLSPQPGRSRKLSAPGVTVGQPALRVTDTGPEVVWAERLGTSEAALWRGSADGRRTRLAGVSTEAPRPRWVDSARDGLLLAFRGQRRARSRSGLYLAPVNAEGRLGAKRRVARADGHARPAVEACAMGLVAATPRIYAGDEFVGVNVLTAEFARKGPEQQYYEDAHGFAVTAVSCARSGALLLIGERARWLEPQVALRAVGLGCG